ncbi:MAG: ABC transporter ATP-binding protein [Clostridium sp.]|nr:ABC transporter ATP-binding protein [Clostridium sp.]
MENILDIKNLCKSYKNFKLDNISFQIKKGFVMGLIGENGAGKTTTIKLIMNLLKKDDGTIEIFDKDNCKYEREIKEKIGFVYDDCFYYENLSIKDNGKIFANFYKLWSWDTFNKYISDFGLNEKQKVKELSKGMKMKFAIALALSHGAEFLIFDEPTSGLDPVMRRQILDIFQNLMEDEKMGILISSHITSDLEQIADYITYIKKGKVVFSETTLDVLDNYKIIKGSLEDLDSIDKNLIWGLRKNKYGFEGMIMDINKLDKSILKKLVIERPTLEDIMVNVNRGGSRNV